MVWLFFHVNRLMFVAFNAQKNIFNYVISCIRNWVNQIYFLSFSKIILWSLSRTRTQKKNNWLKILILGWNSLLKVCWGYFVRRQNWHLARIFIIGDFDLFKRGNKWKKYTGTSHSVDTIISQLIISYSFWRSILQVEFGYLFLVMIVNLT